MIGYIVLEIVFVLAAGVATLVGITPQAEGVLLFVLFGLATLRLARSLSYNLVFKWLRDLAGVVPSPDSSGAGDSNNVPDGNPIGELLSCPICSGTWSALGLYLVYALVPEFGLALLWVFGAAGLSEVLHWWSEAQEWKGREARENAGTQWLQKNGGEK